MTGLMRPPKAVILDWAGTTVDYGSCAPTRVFVETFHRRGIEISISEARAPMGQSKWDHLAAIAAVPRVSALWRERFGHDSTKSDIDAMYHEFLPLQKATLARSGSDVIPGISEAVAALRRQGLKIGSTTGYTRELMDVVAPLAARGGYVPDVIICSDDVPVGRPAPWMNFLAAQHLGVYPMASILVVDDTPVGIEAGRNAGAITVGITQTGNALGLSADAVAALPTDELQSRLDRIEQQFLSIGAHFTLPTAALLPGLVDRLSQESS